MNIVDFLARRFTLHLCLAGLDTVKDIVHMIFDDEPVYDDDPQEDIDDTRNEDTM